MLECLGFTVTTAADGREAVDKFIQAMEEGRPFEITIMDLTIPGGMGGREAVREILAWAPTAKVIVSSGYFSDPVLADHAKYGFAGCLAKPFLLQELDAAVSRALNS